MSDARPDTPAPQADAMRVDESVLAVGEDGRADTSSIVISRGGGSTLAMKTPRTWVRGTEENVHDAHHWLADSVRCEHCGKRKGGGGSEVLCGTAFHARLV